MQQQFEHMNVVFNDIRDRMDRQDVVIASLHEERPRRALMLEGKEGVRALMILMTTMRMSLKMKMIKLHWTMKAGLRQGEKGVVEISKEIQDGKC